VRVGHELKLKVSGLSEILNDINPFYPQEYERKEKNVDELDRQE
jgi:hypothetical protein